MRVLVSFRQLQPLRLRKTDNLMIIEDSTVNLKRKSFNLFHKNGNILVNFYMQQELYGATIKLDSKMKCSCSLVSADAAMVSCRWRASPTGGRVS